MRSRYLIVASITVLLAVCGALGAAPAEAGKLRYRDLKVKVRHKTVPFVAGDAKEVTASCPRGSSLLSGGVFYHPDGLGPSINDAPSIVIAASYPRSKRAWTVQAANLAGGSTMRLTVTVHCTAVKAGITRIQGSLQIISGSADYGFPRCPAGQPIAGGGWFSGTNVQGAPPSLSVATTARVASSAPISNGWYAEGANETEETRWFNIAMLCATKLRDLQGASGDSPFPVGNNQPAGGYLTCPDGTRIVAGGSYVHDGDNETTNGGLALRTTVAGSAPTNDALGWFSAFTIDQPTPQGLELGTLISCLER